MELVIAVVAGPVLFAYLSWRMFNRLDVIHDLVNSRMSAAQNEIADLRSKIDTLEGNLSESKAKEA